jgi:hypothetical protein
MNTWVRSSGGFPVSRITTFIGDHAGDWDLQGSGTTPQSVSITSRVSGSSIICVTLGEFTNYTPPTDNKGNTLDLLQNSGYAGGLWPGFGMEVYGKASMVGGSSHATQITKNTGTDESTLIVVEVTGTSNITSTSIVAVSAGGAGVPYSSSTVNTTGPALLVSAWGGDGDTSLTDQTCNPEIGWTMIESLFLGGTAYIQAAVAVRQVMTAGSYSVDWTPVQNQGGIVFLAALQA